MVEGADVKEAVLKMIPARPQMRAMRATYHRYWAGSGTRSTKWKLVPFPKKQRVTMVAVMADVIVGRRTAPEKLRWSSSKANIMPASGALKAAASPALAPLVMRYRSSMRVRPSVRERPCPATAAIWMEGPSRPSESPAPMPMAPARIFTQRMRSHFIFMRPRMTPFTCGMPEPPAMGA